LAAIEAAEQEIERVEEKKRREAEGIMDDEVEVDLPNLNQNPEIIGYPDHDGFYDDGHQGLVQQQQQQQRDRIDRPPMRFETFVTFATNLHFVMWETQLQNSHSMIFFIINVLPFNSLSFNGCLGSF